MPVTLAIRLLPSDVVSFNLWIALPLPLAALGMFLFLRRRPLPDAAAALGACAFALSGPVVSMLNTPNLSWSVALMPWVLAAIDRPITLAIVFALQGSAASPSRGRRRAVVAACYSIFRLKAETTESKEEIGSAFLRPPWLPPLGGRSQSSPALAAGALLAAAQLVPTAMAGVRAHRGALATPDFWSLHPFALWETIAPGLFGNYYDAFLADLPWMGALNFGRDPFFYSLYVGPLVLLLAGVGLAGAVPPERLLARDRAGVSGRRARRVHAAVSARAQAVSAADVFPVSGEVPRRQPLRLRGPGGRGVRASSATFPA